MHHAAGDVADIGRALPQEIVLHALEDVDVALDDLLEAELDVETGGPDLLADVVDERDVIEDEQVRVENGGFGLA